jgi:hypothetical protein
MTGQPFGILLTSGNRGVRRQAVVVDARWMGKNITSQACRKHRRGDT